MHSLMKIGTYVLAFITVVVVLTGENRDRSKRKRYSFSLLRCSDTHFPDILLLFDCSCIISFNIENVFTVYF